MAVGFQDDIKVTRRHSRRVIAGAESNGLPDRLDTDEEMLQWRKK